MGSAAVPGQKVFPSDCWSGRTGFTARSVQAPIRALAVALSVPNASSLTLKCFRKGHAVEMAVHGAPLQVILQAGEWRSAACLAYVDADIADLRQIIASRLDTADDDA